MEAGSRRPCLGMRGNQNEDKNRGHCYSCQAHRLRCAGGEVTRSQRTTTIADVRETKYHKQGGRCFICGRPVRFALFQLAHVIPQRKWCLSHFGEDVIHHPMNMHGVCGLACNGRAQINPDSLEAEMFAESIREAIHGSLDEIW